MTAKEFVISIYPDALCKIIVYYTLPAKYNYSIYTSTDKKNIIGSFTCMNEDRFQGEQIAWETAEKFIKL